MINLFKNLIYKFNFQTFVKYKQHRLPYHLTITLKELQKNMKNKKNIHHLVKIK